MRFLKFLSLAACGLFAGALSAQVGVYVLATGQHMSNVKYTTTTTPWTLGGPNTGDFSPLGYTIGGYYDFKKFGPATFGIDVRGGSTTSKKGVVDTATAAGGRIYSALGGARFSFQTKLAGLHISPYAEGAVGLVKTNFGVLTAQMPGPQTPSSTGRVSNVNFNGYVGADVALAPVLSLRLEGGTGLVHGNSESTPLQTYSVGIVFHTRPRQ